MNFFEAMDLYQKALSKIVDAKVVEDERTGKKPRLLSELMETINEVPLGNGMVARHFYEGGQRKVKFEKLS